MRIAFLTLFFAGIFVVAAPSPPAKAQSTLITQAQGAGGIGGRRRGFRFGRGGRRFGRGRGRGRGRGGVGGAAGGPLPLLGATIFGQLVGAGGLYVAWRRRKKKRAKPRTQSA